MAGTGDGVAASGTIRHLSGRFVITVDGTRSSGGPWTTSRPPQSDLLEGSGNDSRATRRPGTPGLHALSTRLMWESTSQAGEEDGPCRPVSSRRWPDARFRPSRPRWPRSRR
jgi:hypothetical protein